jgi:hypothetical protein
MDKHVVNFSAQRGYRPCFDMHSPFLATNRTRVIYDLNSLYYDIKVKKVKQSLYTPWRRLGREEI